MEPATQKKPIRIKLINTWKWRPARWTEDGHPIYINPDDGSTYTSSHDSPSKRPIKITLKENHPLHNDVLNKTQGGRVTKAPSPSPDEATLLRRRRRCRALKKKQQLQRKWEKQHDESEISPRLGHSTDGYPDPAAHTPSRRLPEIG